MEEKDQNQGFDLEDILKEFGEASEQPVPEEETPDEAAAEQPDEEPVAVWAPKGTRSMEDTHVIPQVTGDTQVLPKVTGDTVVIARVKHDTIRMAPVRTGDQEETSAEQTQRFEPVQNEAGPEPYSQEWEPEYEQPMGEYIPPQPIVFRPRSRLRELKRKLIAGPERRYYELSEQGVGKLQIAMILSLVVVVLSVGATVLYELDMVQDNRMKFMVFGQFFAMMVSALLGVYQMMDGIRDIFRLRFSLNSLLFLTFIVCCVDGVFCLQELRVPCCAAFSLQVTMSLWSGYHQRYTEMGMMDTMRKAVRLDSLVASPDYYAGRTGILRGEGRVEDFMDNFNQPTGPEKAVSVYAVLAFLAGIGAGVMGFLLYDLSAAFQAAAVTLLAAAPASFFVTISRPTAILEKRLHSLGAVLCGWQGVLGLTKKTVFPLTHEDLFPAGTAKMNGVKFYGDREPDEVVAYATAIISANGGGLVPLFEGLLDSRSGKHYEAENLRAYDGGGVGGEVCGESVLVGVMSFMKDMGVEIPEGTRVNSAVYVAVDGELCGLFAITYEKDRSSAAGMRTLCSYRSLKNVLTTSDFMLTEGFIRGKFGIRTKRIIFPEQDVRLELQSVEADGEACALAMTTQSGLAPKAFAVTGSKALKTACRVGVTVHILAGLVGIAMMLVLTWYGALHLLTPANMFLYALLWTVPGLLITGWTRSV